MMKFLGKLAFMLATTFAFISSANAQIYSTFVNLIIFENSSLDGETFTVNAGEPILSTEAVSPRSVRLLEDLTVGVLGTGHNLPKGAILFGRYDDTVWTYCGSFDMNAESTTASVVALGVLTAGASLLLEAGGMDRANTICLQDEDNDGMFDAAWGDSSPARGSSLIVYSLTEKTMNTKTSYEMLDLKEGPRFPVTIKWSKLSNAARISFSIQIVGKSTSTEVVDIPTIGDDPVTVKLGSAEFKLLGYDAETNSIDVEMIDGLENNYFRLPAILRVTTSYYYY